MKILHAASPPGASRRSGNWPFSDLKAGARSEKTEDQKLKTASPQLLTFARPDVPLASELSALALAAKASHGYGPERLSAWRAELTVSAEYLQTHTVRVAYWGQQLAAWGAVSDWGRRCRLDHLWVAPAHQRQGIGRALLSHLAATAQSARWTELAILSDPLAVGFYQRCGALPAGEELQSDGRRLPLLILPL